MRIHSSFAVVALVALLPRAALSQTPMTLPQVEVTAPSPFAAGLGIETVRADEFNCAGKYSDARPGDCAELDFARRNSPELRGAFKVPTLRNLPKTVPYMRVGDRRALEDAMWHYRTLPTVRVGQSELNDLPITSAEFDQLEAFLRTLEGPIDALTKCLRPPEIAKVN